MDLCDIIDVSLSGKVDDYAVSIAYPNLYIVFEGGHHTYYPIYSAGMYEVLERHHATPEWYEKVDKVYADYTSAVGKLSGDLYQAVSDEIAKESEHIQELRSEHMISEEVG